MTELNRIGTSVGIAAGEAALPLNAATKMPVLPEPTASAFMSGDPLSEMMMAMQHMADTSFAISSTRIHDTQAALHGKLEDYLEKLQEICEKLRAAREEADDGGFFSDCFDFVGDLLGELVGTLTDLEVDLVKLPADIVVNVANNLNDPAAMMQALQSTGAQLFENGSTAEDVHGFTQGVVSFAADFTELTARLQIALAKGALTGESLEQALGPDLKKLWNSTKQNLLDNPHFWAVVNAVGKGVAVAAAVTSGGALAPVALGLMVLMEADQRYGVIEKVVGKDAAPFVRMGVTIAAAACVLSLGASGSRALDLLRAGSTVLQGGGAIYAGYRARENSSALADQLEDQAELTSTLNSMQRLQRLLDKLLGSLEDDEKSNEQSKKLGTALVETQVATNAAAVFAA